MLLLQIRYLNCAHSFETTFNSGYIKFVFNLGKVTRETSACAQMYRGA